jgi:thiol-disulfide isomerase/thioredoxin
MTSQLELIHLTTNGKKTDGEKDINKKAKTNPNDVLKAFNANKPMFIEFYANWCGHCKTLEKEWEKLVELAEKDKDVKNVAIVSIESGVVNKELDKMQSEMKLKVNGFPTVGVIKNKKFISYDGGRNAKEMLAYIKSDVLHKQGGGMQSGGMQSGGMQRGGNNNKSIRKRRTVKRRTVKNKRRVRWIRTTRPKRKHYFGCGNRTKRIRRHV